jgi:hypothetical protein
MTNDLTVPPKGGYSTRPDPKKEAMAAAKARAAEAKTGVKASDAAIIKYIPPGDCAERIRCVFDDSGSMTGQIEHAKQGVVEFLRNCVPNQTAVAVHFMNTTPAIALQSDLVKLGNDILERNLTDGGTPFFNTLKQALEATPVLTRLVAFTDGSPTDELRAEESTELQSMWGRGTTWTASADIIIKIAHNIGDQSLTPGGFVSKTSGAHGPCIPIDTVFFGNAEWSKREMDLLKYLSDKTGGFFLHFDPAKPGIWKQMKYLAPVNRLMLTSESFRAEVERGK